MVDLHSYIRYFSGELIEMPEIAEVNSLANINVSRRGDEWFWSVFGNGLQLKIRSELKLNLSHVKMEYKHGSKHDRDQTRFVYQYNILSELHKSRCSLEEFPQKLQNSILSVFLKTHSWQGCTYHGCLVTGASIFHNEGPNICSINITIQKYVPVQTNRE